MNQLPPLIVRLGPRYTVRRMPPCFTCGAVSTHIVEDEEGRAVGHYCAEDWEAAWLGFYNEGKGQ